MGGYSRDSLVYIMYLQQVVNKTHHYHPSSNKNQLVVASQRNGVDMAITNNIVGMPYDQV